MERRPRSVPLLGMTANIKGAGVKETTTTATARERERKIEKEAGGKKWERGKEAWTGKSVKCVRSKARHPPSRWCNTFSDGAANNQSRSSLFTGASPRRTGQWRSGAPARRFRGTSNLPRRRWVPLTFDIFVFINIPHCISLYILPFNTNTHTHTHPTFFWSRSQFDLLFMTRLNWLKYHLVIFSVDFILTWYSISPTSSISLGFLREIFHFPTVPTLIWNPSIFDSITVECGMILDPDIFSISPPPVYLYTVGILDRSGEKSIHVYHLLDSNLFFLHLPPSLSPSQFKFYVFYHFALANVIAVGHLDWIRIDSMCARLYLCAFYHFSNFIILIFLFFRPYFFSISRGFRFGMPNECCLSSFVLFFHYSTLIFSFEYERWSFSFHHSPFHVKTVGPLLGIERSFSFWLSTGLYYILRDFKNGNEKSQMYSPPPYSVDLFCRWIRWIDAGGTWLEFAFGNRWRG